MYLFLFKEESRSVKKSEVMWWIIGWISITSCLISYHHAKNARSHAREAKDSVVTVEKYTKAVQLYVEAAKTFTTACEFYANDCEKITNVTPNVHETPSSHTDQTDTQ